MAGYIQVMTTTAGQTDAQAIARMLVERRLAACVQVLGPLTSTYRWQGQIEVAEEWLCIIKTREDLYGAIEAAIREIHPYQTPEILATPVTAGSQAYLAWLEGEVSPAR